MQQSHEQGHWYSTVQKPDTYFRLAPSPCSKCADTGYFETVKDAKPLYVGPKLHFYAQFETITVPCDRCCRLFWRKRKHEADNRDEKDAKTPREADSRDKKDAKTPREADNRDEKDTETPREPTELTEKELEALLE